jgi:hypothetical protein
MKLEDIRRYLATPIAATPSLAPVAAESDDDDGVGDLSRFQGARDKYLVSIHDKSEGDEMRHVNIWETHPGADFVVYFSATGAFPDNALVEIEGHLNPRFDAKSVAVTSKHQLMAIAKATLSKITRQVILEGATRALQLIKHDAVDFEFIRSFTTDDLPTPNEVVRKRFIAVAFRVTRPSLIHPHWTLL